MRALFLLMVRSALGASRTMRARKSTGAAPSFETTASPSLRMRRFRHAEPRLAHEPLAAAVFTMSNSAVFFVPAARCCARVCSPSSRLPSLRVRLSRKRFAPPPQDAPPLRLSDRFSETALQEREYESGYTINSLRSQ